MHIRVPLLIALGAAVLLSACASAPPPRPDDMISQAEYAIDQAKQTVTDETRSLRLYEAEQKLKQARKLAQAEDDKPAKFAKARRLAQEATQAARLAAAKANQQQAEAQEQEMQDSLDVLRHELKRKEGTE